MSISISEIEVPPIGQLHVVCQKRLFEVINILSIWITLTSKHVIISSIIFLCGINIFAACEHFLPWNVQGHCHLKCGACVVKRVMSPFVLL